MSAISKFGKVNTFFQITYFLLGSSHTVDGAYFLARDLLVEREQALQNAQVKKLEKEAEIMRLQSVIDDLGSKPWDKKKAEAELLRMNLNGDYVTHLFSQAQAEHDFLKRCCEVLQEKRKYKDYSDSEAHELSQREEWLGELLERVENMLLTGGIPHNELETFRHHPDFKQIILPHIKNVREMLNSPDGPVRIGETRKNKVLLVLMNDKLLSQKLLSHESEKQLDTLDK